MCKVESKNIFISNNDDERNKKFNEIWQNIVRLMINK